MTETHKLIYWHRELPPLSEALAGEYVVEAHSDPVPYRLTEHDALFDRCLPNLKARLAERVEQEIHRLGGSCAHVLDEHVEPHIDNSTGEYTLRGRLTYVLLVHPPKD